MVPEDSHDEGEDSDEDWEEVMSALDSPWSVDGGEERCVVSASLGACVCSSVVEVLSTVVCSVFIGTLRIACVCVYVSRRHHTSQTDLCNDHYSLTGGDDDPPLAEGPLLLPSEAAGEDTQQQEEPFTRIQGAAQLQQLLEATPGLVVLDVHSAPETDVTENTASASLSGETDATGSSSTSVQGETPPLSNATDGGSITSSSVHVIPIHELSGDRARVLAAAPGVIVLNGPDHRGVQACVRLSRVYHAPRVFLYST